MQQKKVREVGPDLVFEAMVPETDPQTGEQRRRFLPIGAAVRTEDGNYVGEIDTIPVDWFRDGARQKWEILCRLVVRRDAR